MAQAKSPHTPRRGATAAQIKADIDRGRTGDKTPGLDPAAAPLGTDEEAGGWSLAPEALGEVRGAERKGPAHAHPHAATGAIAPDAALRGGSWRWIGAALLAGLGAGALLLLLV